MTAERSLVDGYWTAHRLATSSVRSDRLAAEDWRWAVEAVDAAMDRADDSALDLLDDLIGAPGADPVYVGAGPLENLLTEHGAEVADRVAERARREPLWREAVGGVWLDAPVAEVVAVLGPYLPAR